MMGKIKAIQTKYNGYHFRSRLEARWAVFFDRIGVRYRYELEGFTLPSGNYLPDFWIEHPLDCFASRGWGFWVEVKPSPMLCGSGGINPIRCI